MEDKVITPRLRASLSWVEIDHYTTQELRRGLEEKAKGLFKGKTYLGVGWDDLVQDTLTQIHKQHKTTSVGAAKVWLQQDYYHLLDKYRNNQTHSLEEMREEHIEYDFAAPGYLTTRIDPEVLKGLQEALTGRQLEVCVLTAEYDLTQQEIATKLGIHQTSVGRLLDAAGKRIKFAV